MSTPTRRVFGTGSPSVGDLELRPVVTVPADVTLAEVARVLDLEHSAFVAVDTDPQAIVSVRDVVRAVGEGLHPAAPAAEVGASGLLVAHADAAVVAVAAVMVREHATCVLVVDAVHRPLGVADLSTVLSVLLDDLALAGGLRVALHIEAEG